MKLSDLIIKYGFYKNDVLNCHKLIVNKDCYFAYNLDSNMCFIVFRTESLINIVRVLDDKILQFHDKSKYNELEDKIILNMFNDCINSCLETEAIFNKIIN